MWLGCCGLPELAAKNLFLTRVITILDNNKQLQDNYQWRSPLSSVVERVTRNDEVGCSIQPAGILHFIFLYRHALLLHLHFQVLMILMLVVQ